MITPTARAKAIIRKLRPPSARSMKVTHLYGEEGRSNPGYTLQVVTGEMVIAPGDGVVASVVYKQMEHRHAPGHDYSYEVTIDHSNGVVTKLAGLKQPIISSGQSVSRGQPVGDVVDTEVFFGFAYNDTVIDPQQVNRHFRMQTERQVVGQGQKVRFAPDKISRDLSGDTYSVVFNGMRWFVNRFCATPQWLINVDFNGNGQKQGRAKVGHTETDYWNVYTPANFTANPSAFCYGQGIDSFTYSVDPFVFLKDHKGQATVVRMERQPNHDANAGTTAAFDAMLSTYIGNGTYIWKIKGIPTGVYELYLYAPIATTFYFGKTTETPVAKTVTPTGAGSFIENDNYVKYSVSIAEGDAVLLQCFNGVLSGLQLLRV